MLRNRMQQKCKTKNRQRAGKKNKLNRSLRKFKLLNPFKIKIKEKLSKSLPVKERIESKRVKPIIKFDRKSQKQKIK